MVAQIAVKEEGMELLAEHQLYDDPEWGKREFLGSTDERFRPVDAMNGPDGALYVIDMYRGIAQDQHFLTDELREQIFKRQLDKPLGHGRIWRVRHTGGKAERSFPALADVSSKQLMTSLSHANGWVRDTAQRLLLKRAGDLRSGLAKLARGDETLPAIHALWTMAGRGELERALVLDVAAMNDPKRQYQALRAGGSQLQAADVLSLARGDVFRARAVANAVGVCDGGACDRPGCTPTSARDFVRTVVQCLCSPGRCPRRSGC